MTLDPVQQSQIASLHSALAAGLIVFAVTGVVLLVIGCRRFLRSRATTKHDPLYRELRVQGRAKLNQAGLFLLFAIVFGIGVVATIDIKMANDRRTVEALVDGKPAHHDPATSELLQDLFGLFQTLFGRKEPQQ